MLYSMGEFIFFSRAAPFDCGLENWSCMSRNVKGDKLVCMVSESICTYVSLVGLLYRRCKLDVDLAQVDLMNFRVELGREAAVV